MRTTVTVDDAVYRQFKMIAARMGTSVGSVIEEAMRTFLIARESGERADLSLPTMRSGGLQPGVDLDDMSSVYARLDDGRPLDALR